MRKHGLQVIIDQYKVSLSNFLCEEYNAQNLSLMMKDLTRLERNLMNK